MIELDCLLPTANQLNDRRLAWFAREKRKANMENRKPRACPLKTRSQLWASWCRKFGTEGERSAASQCFDAVEVKESEPVALIEPKEFIKDRVDDGLLESKTNSCGASDLTRAIAVAQSGCEGGFAVNAATASKPAWVEKAEAVLNVRCVGFEEDGKPVFALSRTGRVMAFTEDETPELARVRPKGYRLPRHVAVNEREENEFFVGWDSDGLEIYVERR